MDLVLQGRALADQITAIPGQRPESEAEVVHGPLEQAEAVDRGPVDGVQVGLVGLVARVGRQAELLGGEGMDGADLEPGIGEGPPDRLVVMTGPLHGDDEVVEPVVQNGLSELLESGSKPGLSVWNLDGGDQDLAEEVGEHPLGPGLGAIDADDTEVVGPDPLDAGMQGSGGLVDLMPALPATTPEAGRNSHGIDLYARADGSTEFSRGSREEALGSDFSPRLATYQDISALIWAVPSMANILGYARVSTIDLDLDGQRRRLTAAGAIRIFNELALIEAGLAPTRAARQLGIGRSTLYRVIAERKVA